MSEENQAVNWEVVSGNCGFDAKGDVEVAIVNRVGLFAFESALSTPDNPIFTCIVHGRTSCGGDSLEQVKASGIRRASMADNGSMSKAAMKAIISQAPTYGRKQAPTTLKMEGTPTNLPLSNIPPAVAAIYKAIHNSRASYRHQVERLMMADVIYTALSSSKHPFVETDISRKINVTSDTRKRALELGVQHGFLVSTEHNGLPAWKRADKMRAFSREMATH